MGLKLLINSLARGGAEKQLAALSHALPHEELLTLENEILQNPRNRPVPLSSHTGRTPPLFKTAFLPLYARRLASRCGPGDTVLSFMERANIVNVMAAAASGHRAVICERTSPSGEFSGLRGALMRPLISRYYPRASLVVANSEGGKLELENGFSVPPAKLRVIPNGCEAEKLLRLAAEPLPDGWDRIFQRPVVITGGRLTKAKGHWHLLRIFSVLARDHSGTCLVILGEGELEKYLVSLANELGLRVFSGPGAPPADADVYFAGHRTNPCPFLSRARLFAFTSLWEGFPNALLEAMACGTPVVSADCSSGPREILAPEPKPRPRTLEPEHAEFGILMPVLSGTRLPAAAPPEPAELSWISELSAMLRATAALRVYSGLGVKRAADFELAKIAGLWTALLRGPEITT